MPDISMCKGFKCDCKKWCYRFRAKPNPYRQSYFVLNQKDLQIIKITPNLNEASILAYGCKYFVSIQDYSERYLDPYEDERKQSGDVQGVPDAISTAAGKKDGSKLTTRMFRNSYTDD